MTIMSQPAPHHTQWRPVAIVMLLSMLGATLGACTWGGGRNDHPAETPPHMVWPEPPDQARIELVSVFGTAADLGITRSIWARLASLITGSGDLRMARPVGVAAAGSRIAVADPEAALVHVYDVSQHRALALTTCGDATLAEPVAVAFLDDRLYVSDALGGCIYVFTSDGGCEGRWSLEDGSRPAGLAADAERARLYVADTGAHQVLGFDRQGHNLLRIGHRGTAVGAFNYPTWLALDATGNLYVTDALNFRVQIFDPTGTPLAQFGMHGDGSGQLARPNGIGVDRDGHVYLVDALFDAVQLFDSEGHYLMVFGSRGNAPGQFWLPAGLAISGERIYVADAYNQRIQVFRILRGPS